MDWEGQGGESGWGGAWLMMEWIEGPVVRVVLEKWEAWMRAQEKSGSLDAGQIEAQQARVKDLFRRVGGTIASLHKAGVVHGDLTTSNLMLRVGDGSVPYEDIDGPGTMEGEIVIIDFGLAGQSIQDEDKAVDLYVLERAIGSTHPLSEPFFEELLVGYKHGNKAAVSTLRRLEDVRMRGRKRSMLG
ncbi:hypothetical protein N7456_010225 [Penicillium angulare]|uniref:EKC/KEOPS complex subunit BUD32 n=1 Tax=Penicillium angulare TaxID=116970 RepID=A0A9W9K601_9EURO|nr:hypothetical protein N7456_010225 [Penicillium angulare]